MFGLSDLVGKVGKRFLSHSWIANEVRIGGKKGQGLGGKGTFEFIRYCFTTEVVGIGGNFFFSVVSSKKQRDCSVNSNVKKGRSFIFLSLMLSYLAHPT